MGQCSSEIAERTDKGALQPGGHLERSTQLEIGGNWKLGEIGNCGELEIMGNWKFRGCDSPPGGTWSTRSPKAGTETGTSPKTGAIPFALKGFGGELKVSSRYQSAPSPHRRRLNLDRSHQTPREMFDILQLHSLHHEQ